MTMRRKVVSSMARRWRAVVAPELASARAGGGHRNRSSSAALVGSRTLRPVLAGSISRRDISSSVARREKVNMTFVEDDGNVVKVEAEQGKTLLEVAHDNDVDLEGACGGDLACSTCHVILPQKYYDKLGEKLEEEDDMLDLAWGLTDTSRLGCQIKVSAELEGMEIKIPEDTIDMR